MIYAFLVGLSVAAMGLLASLIARNLQISLIISGSLSIIALIIASMIANFSLILKKKVGLQGKTEDISLKQGERLARAITLFASPNAVVAVFLYFRLYK